MDMDMSTHGGNVASDYSDYEYQVASAQVILVENNDSTGDSSPRASCHIEFEPLDTAGGLDNNEVAELVYLETQAVLEHEDEPADQDVGTSSEVRGNIGINLPPTEGAYVDNNAGSQNTVTGTVVDPVDIAEDNVLIEGTTRVDDRYLQAFKVVGGPPFDDGTSGPGGNNFSTFFRAEKHYRQMVGRGPVVDSTDTITALITTAAEDTVIQIIGDVKIHMIWDVAEVSDAGRAFSVPDGL